MRSPRPRASQIQGGDFYTRLLLAWPLLQLLQASQYEKGFLGKENSREPGSRRESRGDA